MKFIPYQNPWSLDKWQTECPELTYKVLEPDEFPTWLPSGLVSKFNSVVMAASGTSECYVGILMGYRIDHNRIDEHPFVVAFDKQNSEHYSGFIEHGAWNDRTTSIPPEMEKLMAASGMTVNFSFSRKPLSASGGLMDLKNQGILNGYELAVSTIVKERKLNNNTL